MKTVQPIRDLKKLEKLKSVLGHQNARDRMLFLTGIHTGLRISDILKLRVRDVQGTHIRIKEKKTGKMIRRLINPTLRRELNKYIDGKNGRVVLFPSRNGVNKPLTRSGAYKMLRRAAAEVGIDEIGTHTMRKTFGYHMYLKDGKLGRLQMLLNHSSEAVTMRYIGITQDELDDSMRDFNI